MTAKRFKPADSRSRGNTGHTCGKCGKAHEGACRSTTGCHKCGREGHIVRDFHQQDTLSSTRVCYHYDRVGYMKSSYPLIAARLVQALELNTLRIMGGRQGRAEAVKAMGRAFQLITEKATAAHNFVTGMFQFIIMSSYFLICL